MTTDFGGLRGIVDEAKAIQDEVDARPLLDCPICGTPLQRRVRDGYGDCPMGHFETTAQTYGEYYGAA